MGLLVVFRQHLQRCFALFRVRQVRLADLFDDGWDIEDSPVANDMPQPRRQVRTQSGCHEDVRNPDVVLRGARALSAADEVAGERRVIRDYSQSETRSAGQQREAIRTGIRVVDPAVVLHVLFVRSVEVRRGNAFDRRT